LELTTYLGKIKEILLSLVLYHMDTGREDQQCKTGTVTLKSRNRRRERKERKERTKGTERTVTDWENQQKDKKRSNTGRQGR
jgi:hypothetical protein